MPRSELPESAFGEELKRNRLLREVSLESIASATKISVRHLEALERGDYQRLPAPVFTRGFIRAYAGFLGLDPDEMVNAYLSEIGVSPRVPDAGPAHRTARAPSTRLLVLAAVAAAVAILVAAGVWRRARRPHPPVAHPALLPPVSLSPHIRQVPAAPVSPAGSTAAGTGAPPPEPPPALPASAGARAPDLPPAGNDSLVLSIRLEADCWSEIFADERLLFSGVLRRGEDRNFEARKGFRVTMGNAAAARISVNGRELPPLGKPGEVIRNVRLDAERVQEILSRKG